MIRILTLELAAVVFINFFILFYLPPYKTTTYEIPLPTPSLTPTPSPTPTLKKPPTSYTLPESTHVFQTFNNCGPASLSMTLSILGINVGQGELGQELRPYQIPGGDNDDKSVTLPELANKAQDYGFTSFYRPGGTIETLKLFLSYDIPVITRTWLKENDFIGHYRVIRGYDDVNQTLLQDDSLQGKNLTYFYSEFERLWEGFNFEFLVLVPEEKVQITKAILGENVNETYAWENALKEADEALKTNPENIFSQFNRSVALYHLQLYDDAAGTYEAVEHQLPFRMLWYQIEPILIYQKLGNYERVIAMTDRLLERGNRAFSEAYQIRGEIYEAQGQTALAQAEFRKVYFYNTNFYKYWK